VNFVFTMIHVERHERDTCRPNENEWQ